MTEHAPDRIWSGIDIPKTIAGVLAAVSAAVIGSFLGVAGTLAGAAVASLIGSVGTEIYHRSIDRGRKKIEGTFLAPAAVGTPPVEAAVEEKPSQPSTPSRIRWKRVAMVAGALFVLAMGALTAAELVAGRSIADATRGGNGDRATLTSLFTDKSGGAKEPATNPTPAPSGSTAPTDNATTPNPDQPSSTPTGDLPITQSPTGDGGQTGTDSAPSDTGTGDGTAGDTKSGTGTGDSAGTGKSDTQRADTQNPSGTE
ncbi:hypothetical protein GCM10010172_42100 [Paractinoplanes ferrugineus]|uniref:Uncharacterized protein n=1 Tax=Paractinoplanes ferrugineus TaxID=113564 RepID=A0A919J3P6_9ACTN|nr:hypothetical protein [Actinoplanes ferrugineus]GIE13370.1 hypothetical protein Afe05nite_52100 [Actinoplanes ferrugineus]